MRHLFRLALACSLLLATGTIMGADPGGSGELGDPVEPEAATADGKGRVRVFAAGAIYDHPGVGQVTLRGELWRKYDAMGRDRCALGLPTSGTVQTTDYVGEHAYFQYGVMYWSKRTGAHWLGSGPLLYKYVDLDRQRGFLGWPVGDPHEADGRTQVDFEHGRLAFSEREGVAVSRVGLMVVAPERFAAALEPFARHVTQAGMGARVVTLEYVADRYRNVSRDLPEAIRRAIFDHRVQFGSEHVLLVGEVDTLPTRVGEDAGWAPGSWDLCVPGDRYYGLPVTGPGGTGPTVAVGRLALREVEEVRSWCEGVVRHGSGWSAEAPTLARREDGAGVGRTPPKGGGSERAELLVLSPGEFLPALVDLAEHKRRTGMSCRVVALESVEEGDRGVSRDLPEAVKRFVFEHWSRCGTKYVLLVGDITRMPARYCFVSEEESFAPGVYDFSMYGHAPTDLYYACLVKEDGSFDDWDRSGNGRFGEIHTERVNFDRIDLRPTVAVARVAAWKREQVETYVRKVIRYETTAGGKEWTKRAAVVGLDWGVGSAEAMARSLAGLSLTRFIQGAKPGKGVRSPDHAELTRVIDEGVLFAAHSGHGWQGGWVGAWDAQAAFPQLRNGDRLPVLCSAGCLTLMWTAGAPLNADGTSSPPTREPIRHWAEPPPAPAPMQPESARVGDSMATFMLLQNENGAIAAYGFSNVAQGGYSDALIQGVLASYAQGHRIAGDLWAQSLRSYADAQLDAGGNPIAVGHWCRRAAFVQPYKFVLFGDPSLRIGGVPPAPGSE